MCSAHCNHSVVPRFTLLLTIDSIFTSCASFNKAGNGVAGLSVAVDCTTDVFSAGKQDGRGREVNVALWPPLGKPSSHLKRRTAMLLVCSRFELFK